MKGGETYIMNSDFSVEASFIYLSLESLVLIDMKLQVQIEIFHLRVKDKLNFLLAESRFTVL
jgi:hypothetical protein